MYVDYNYTQINTCVKIVRSMQTSLNMSYSNHNKMQDAPF